MGHKGGQPASRGAVFCRGAGPGQTTSGELATPLDDDWAVCTFSGLSFGWSASSLP